MTPIGRMRTCFSEKFGIPRQPGLVPEAAGTIELFPPYDREETVRGLTTFSHIWVVYLFHGNRTDGWRPTVRPPRLGGNRRVGVFASRSPFRPNPIGMSALRLCGTERKEGRRLIHVSGVDILDRTPVLDIKPYLPWTDSIPHAEAGFAPEPPEAEIPVTFTAAAAETCIALEAGPRPGFRRLITRVLALDPRPAYRSKDAPGRVFGMKIHDRNIRWEVGASEIRVLSIDPVADLSTPDA